MPAAFRYELLAMDGHARRGRIHTPHGTIETPAFMPVGTRATVKGLTPEQVRTTGAEILLGNTYHLLLRPGSDVVAHFGGLHRFMNWPHPILTDSGGFQVFSLASLNRITDDGVEFQSHIDGQRLRLDPETSIRVQNQLGADIIMAFDECPPLPAAPDQLQGAVRRSITWARRSREAHQREDQALYGITQGGLNRDLRLRCLEALVEIGFDGYAIGGLSVGEPPEQMHAILPEIAPPMPMNQPRYLMGVGRPIDLVHAVAAGVDQFDCVMPTRNGRKAYAFTSRGVKRLRNARYKLSDAPLDPACDCACCSGHSLGYLRHLFLTEEHLGPTLVSIHNLRFYQSLMQQMRDAIEQRRFDDWRRAFLASPASTERDEEQ